MTSVPQKPASVAADFTMIELLPNRMLLSTNFPSSTVVAPV